MKDETLRDILKNLNTGRGKNLLYRRPIGGNIEFARDVIIPFIWRENLASRDYPLEITISRGIGPKNFQASIKLAKAIGFKMDVENEDIAKLKIDYNEPVPIGEAWR